MSLLQRSWSKRRWEKEGQKKCMGKSSMFSCHVVQGFDSFSSGTDCDSKEGVRKALVLIFLQEIPENEETGRCWAIQSNLAEQTRWRNIWLTRIKFFGMIICYYCGIVVLIHKSKIAHSVNPPSQSWFVLCYPWIFVLSEQWASILTNLLSFWKNASILSHFVNTCFHSFRNSIASDDFPHCRFFLLCHCLALLHHPRLEMLKFQFKLVVPDFSLLYHCNKLVEK